jgi:hypothetical protein
MNNPVLEVTYAARIGGQGMLCNHPFRALVHHELVWSANV